MARLINNGEAVYVYGRKNHEDSLLVEHAQVVDTGDLPFVELDDCYEIGEGAARRRWPKSRWSLEAPKRKPASKGTDDAVVTAAQDPATPAE